MANFLVRFIADKLGYEVMNNGHIRRKNDFFDVLSFVTWVDDTFSTLLSFEQADALLGIMEGHGYYLKEGLDSKSLVRVDSCDDMKEEIYDIEGAVYTASEWIDELVWDNKDSEFIDDYLKTQEHINSIFSLFNNREVSYEI